MAPGYELIFEDASTLRSTVGVTVPCAPDDDYIALQKELDKHWGVHKRKMCPALRLPSALRRPLSPSMIMGLNTTTTSNSVYNSTATKSPTSPAHSSPPAIRAASSGHHAPNPATATPAFCKQGASSPPMDATAGNTPQQQEHQWTFVGSYQRRPQLAVAIRRVKGNNNSSNTTTSTPQGRVMSPTSYHMHTASHPYARDAYSSQQQQQQRIHAPVRYSGAPHPHASLARSPQQTVPTEMLGAPHMGAASQSQPRGAGDKQDTESAAVTLLLMASGAGSPPRPSPHRSEATSACDSMDSTDISRSSTPDAGLHHHPCSSSTPFSPNASHAGQQHHHPCLSSAPFSPTSHAGQNAEHGAHWRPW